MGDLIIDRVRDAFMRYIAEKGAKPTKVYLGQSEVTELTEWFEGRYAKPYENDSNFICGMLLIEDVEINCLRVGA